MPPRPALPRIFGTQIGLRDWSVVDEIKADMRAGRFAYREQRGKIGGYIDRRGVYCVTFGHHRIVAAIELARETGDASAVLELMRWGQWDDAPRPPSDRRPLPARDWWGAFRHWLGV
jgi:filamentous hemagglutinin